MEYNTIRLIKGTETLTSREYKKFTPGDTIWGIDSEWEELARWNIDDEKRAQEELKKYKCCYNQSGETWDIVEYALEYFEGDEEGEFISGSDYYIANKEEAK